MRTFVSILIFGVCVVTTPAPLSAWTGPTAAPPASNTFAPVNLGTSDQVKNGGLSLNSLAVFGNTILSGASRYLNFGTTAGITGYGIRDNAGSLEFKHSGGSWSPFGASSWTTSGSNIYSANAGSVGVGTTSPLAKLAVGTAAGYANNAYYDIGAARIAANESIYSYGRICVANSAGNCLGTGGTVLRNDGVQFPDGTVQASAAAAGIGSGQTWSNPARSLNTAYQNSTSKPILVSFSVYGNNWAGVTTYEIQVSPNNATWTTAARSYTANYDNSANSMTTIVPSGHYYRFTKSGSNTIDTFFFAELQ